MIKSIWYNKGLAKLTLTIFIGLCTIHVNCLDKVNNVSVYVTWGVLGVACVAMAIQIRRAIGAKKYNNYIYADPKHLLVTKDKCEIQKKDRGRFTVCCSISCMHKINNILYEFSDVCEMDVKNERKFNEALDAQSDIEFVYSAIDPSYNMFVKSDELKEVDNIESIMGWRNDKIALVWGIADVVYAIYIVNILMKAI